MKYHLISVDQAIYATAVASKYFYTDTVKSSTKFYKATFPYNMISNKADASTSDEQVKNLTREFNIHYRACIGLFIYLLSTRVDFIFAVHKLETFSENHGKVHFEVLIKLLRYISLQSVYLRQVLLNINVRCIYIISIHQTE